MLFIENCNVILEFTGINYSINFNKANLAMLISLIKTNLNFYPHYYF
jgi:hypothetical protein